MISTTDLEIQEKGNDAEVDKSVQEVDNSIVISTKYILSIVNSKTVDNFGVLVSQSILCLQLQHCEITNVDFIDKCKQIRNIDLAYNNISTISPVFAGLPYLEILNISHNAIEEFEDLYELKADIKTSLNDDEMPHASILPHHKHHHKHKHEYRFTKLLYLTLRGNPVCKLKNYRKMVLSLVLHEWSIHLHMGTHHAVSDPMNNHRLLNPILALDNRIISDEERYAARYIDLSPVSADIIRVDITGAVSPAVDKCGGIVNDEPIKEATKELKLEARESQPEASITPAATMGIVQSLSKSKLKHISSASRHKTVKHGQQQRSEDMTDAMVAYKLLLHNRKWQYQFGAFLCLFYMCFSKRRQAELEEQKHHSTQATHEFMLPRVRKLRNVRKEQESVGREGRSAIIEAGKVHGNNAEYILERLVSIKKLLTNYSVATSAAATIQRMVRTWILYRRYSFVPVCGGDCESIHRPRLTFHRAISILQASWRARRQRAVWQRELYKLAMMNGINLAGGEPDDSEEDENMLDEDIYLNRTLNEQQNELLNKQYQENVLRKLKHKRENDASSRIAMRLRVYTDALKRQRCTAILRRVLLMHCYRRRFMIEKLKAKCVKSLVLVSKTADLEYLKRAMHYIVSHSEYLKLANEQYRNQVNSEADPDVKDKEGDKSENKTHEELCVFSIHLITAATAASERCINKTEKENIGKYATNEQESSVSEEKRSTQEYFIKFRRPSWRAVSSTPKGHHDNYVLATEAVIKHSGSTVLPVAPGTEPRARHRHSRKNRRYPSGHAHSREPSREKEYSCGAGEYGIKNASGRGTPSQDLDDHGVASTTCPGTPTPNTLIPPPHSWPLLYFDTFGYHPSYRSAQTAMLFKELEAEAGSNNAEGSIAVKSSASNTVKLDTSPNSTGIAGNNTCHAVGYTPYPLRLTFSVQHIRSVLAGTKDVLNATFQNEYAGTSIHDRSVELNTRESYLAAKHYMATGYRLWNAYCAPCLDYTVVELTEEEKLARQEELDRELAERKIREVEDTKLQPHVEGNLKKTEVISAAATPTAAKNISVSFFSHKNISVSNVPVDRNEVSKEIGERSESVDMEAPTKQVPKPGYRCYYYTPYKSRNEIQEEARAAADLINPLSPPRSFSMIQSNSFGFKGSNMSKFERPKKVPMSIEQYRMKLLKPRGVYYISDSCSYFHVPPPPPRPQYGYDGRLRPAPKPKKIRRSVLKTHPLSTAWVRIEKRAKIILSKSENAKPYSQGREHHSRSRRPPNHRHHKHRHSHGVHEKHRDDVHNDDKMTPKDASLDTNDTGVLNSYNVFSVHLSPIPLVQEDDEENETFAKRKDCYDRDCARKLLHFTQLFLHHPRFDTLLKHVAPDAFQNKDTQVGAINGIHKGTRMTKGKNITYSAFPTSATPSWWDYQVVELLAVQIIQKRVRGYLTRKTLFQKKHATDDDTFIGKLIQQRAVILMQRAFRYYQGLHRRLCLISRINKACEGLSQYRPVIFIDSWLYFILLRYYNEHSVSKYIGKHVEHGGDDANASLVVPADKEKPLDAERNQTKTNTNSSSSAPYIHTHLPIVTPTMKCIPEFNGFGGVDKEGNGVFFYPAIQNPQQSSVHEDTCSRVAEPLPLEKAENNTKSGSEVAEIPSHSATSPNPKPNLSVLNGEDVHTSSESHMNNAVKSLPPPISNDESNAQDLLNPNKRARIHNFVGSATICRIPVVDYIVPVSIPKVIHHSRQQTASKRKTHDPACGTSLTDDVGTDGGMLTEYGLDGFHEVPLPLNDSNALEGAVATSTVEESRIKEKKSRHKGRRNSRAMPTLQSKGHEFPSENRKHLNHHKGSSSSLQVIPLDCLSDSDSHLSDDNLLIQSPRPLVEEVQKSDNDEDVVAPQPILSVKVKLQQDGSLAYVPVCPVENKRPSSIGHDHRSKACVSSGGARAIASRNRPKSRSATPSDRSAIAAMGYYSPVETEIRSFTMKDLNKTDGRVCKDDSKGIVSNSTTVQDTENRTISSGFHDSSLPKKVSEMKTKLYPKHGAGNGGGMVDNNSTDRRICKLFDLLTKNIESITLATFQPEVDSVSYGNIPIFNEAAPPVDYNSNIRVIQLKFSNLREARIRLGLIMIATYDGYSRNCLVPMTYKDIQSYVNDSAGTIKQYKIKNNIGLSLIRSTLRIEPEVEKEEKKIEIKVMKRKDEHSAAHIDQKEFRASILQRSSLVKPASMGVDFRKSIRLMKTKTQSKNSSPTTAILSDSDSMKEDEADAACDSNEESNENVMPMEKPTSASSALMQGTARGLISSQKRTLSPRARSAGSSRRKNDRLGELLSPVAAPEESPELNFGSLVSSAIEPHVYLLPLKSYPESLLSAAKYWAATPPPIPTPSPLPGQIISFSEGPVRTAVSSALVSADVKLFSVFCYIASLDSIGLQLLYDALLKYTKALEIDTALQSDDDGCRSGETSAINRNRSRSPSCSRKGRCSPKLLRSRRRGLGSRSASSSSDKDEIASEYFFSERYSSRRRNGSASGRKSPSSPAASANLSLPSANTNDTDASVGSRTGMFKLNNRKNTLDETPAADILSNAGSNPTATVVGVVPPMDPIDDENIDEWEDEETIRGMLVKELYLKAYDENKKKEKARSKRRSQSIHHGKRHDGSNSNDVFKPGPSRENSKEDLVSNKKKLFYMNQLKYESPLLYKDFEKLQHAQRKKIITGVVDNSTLYEKKPMPFPPCGLNGDSGTDANTGTIDNSDQGNIDVMEKKECFDINIDKKKLVVIRNSLFLWCSQLQKSNMANPTPKEITLEPQSRGGTLLNVVKMSSTNKPKLKNCYAMSVDAAISLITSTAHEAAIKAAEVTKAKLPKKPSVEVQELGFHYTVNEQKSLLDLKRKQDLLDYEARKKMDIRVAEHIAKRDAANKIGGSFESSEDVTLSSTVEKNTATVEMGDTVSMLVENVEVGVEPLKPLPKHNKIKDRIRGTSRPVSATRARWNEKVAMTRAENTEFRNDLKHAVKEQRAVEQQTRKDLKNLVQSQEKKSKERCDTKLDIALQMNRDTAAAISKELSVKIMKTELDREEKMEDLKDAQAVQKINRIKEAEMRQISRKNANLLGQIVRKEHAFNVKAIAKHQIAVNQEKVLARHAEIKSMRPKSKTKLDVGTLGIKIVNGKQYAAEYVVDASGSSTLILIDEIGNVYNESGELVVTAKAIQMAHASTSQSEMGYNMLPAETDISRPCTANVIMPHLMPSQVQVVPALDDIVVGASTDVGTGKCGPHVPEVGYEVREAPDTGRSLNMNSQIGPNSSYLNNNSVQSYQGGVIHLGKDATVRPKTPNMSADPSKYISSQKLQHQKLMRDQPLYDPDGTPIRRTPDYKNMFSALKKPGPTSQGSVDVMQNNGVDDASRFSRPPSTPRNIVNEVASNDGSVGSNDANMLLAGSVAFSSPKTNKKKTLKSNANTSKTPKLKTNVSNIRDETLLSVLMQNPTSSIVADYDDDGMFDDSVYTSYDMNRSNKLVIPTMPLPCAKKGNKPKRDTESSNMNAVQMQYESKVGSKSQESNMLMEKVNNLFADMKPLEPEMNATTAKNGAQKDKPDIILGTGTFPISPQPPLHKYE